MSLVIKANRFRFIIAVFSSAALIFWIVYGWDSGLDQVFNPEMYGKSLHFSTLTTYGLLFYYTSKHIESWEIHGFSNIFYSGLLTALNIGLFEQVYVLLFQHFQVDGIIASITRDWFFLLQYVFLTLAGVVGALGLRYQFKGKICLDGKIGVWIRKGKQNYQTYRNKENWTILVVFLLAFTFTLWIFYPFPTTPLQYGTWTRNLLFPQTHYAYVKPTLYASNFLLHGVNVTVKALFALLQLQILRLWRRK